MINSDSFLSSVKSIVYQVLNEKNLINNNVWHYGVITNINSDGTVDAQIDGSKTITKRLAANPDVDFKSSDRVIIIYVFGIKKNAFVLCRRTK